MLTAKWDTAEEKESTRTFRAMDLVKQTNGERLMPRASKKRRSVKLWAASDLKALKARAGKARRPPTSDLEEAARALFSDKQLRRTGVGLVLAFGMFAVKNSTKHLPAHGVGLKSAGSATEVPRIHGQRLRHVRAPCFVTSE
jgi:hypothetical protein